MTGALHHPARSDAAAALMWLVDAGCDVLVEDAPRRWLARDAMKVTPTAAPVIPAQAGTHLPSAREMGSRLRGNDADIGVLDLTVTAPTLAALAAAVAAWDADPLGTGPALFADGAADPGGIVVIGDMPRADDLAAGRVAAGTAGQLLDRMLAAIGRSRADALLTNLVFRPTPAGRPPRDDELAAAAPFVARALELAKPRAILALGGVAAAALAGGTTGFNRTRGRWLSVTPAYGDPLPLLATFHPGALLGHPEQKRLAWTDLLAFQARLAA